MKTLFLALLIISPSAFAANYQCKGPANPNRGFTSDFTVTTATEVGGKIQISAAGETKVLGPVTEVNEITPAQKGAFDTTLGLVAEKDESGLEPADLDRITRILSIKAAGPGDIEIFVYRFFIGERQVGGSILIDMHGTACL